MELKKVYWSEGENRKYAYIKKTTYIQKYKKKKHFFT
jgi:hypothetical protein